MHVQKTSLSTKLYWLTWHPEGHAFVPEQHPVSAFGTRIPFSLSAHAKSKAQDKTNFCFVGFKIISSQLCFCLFIQIQFHIEKCACVQKKFCLWKKHTEVDASQTRCIQKTHFNDLQSKNTTRKQILKWEMPSLERLSRHLLQFYGKNVIICTRF